ncbi:UDP-3-O-acyl-N-acetylglucosamine deacetylase [Roseomonas sp. CCTCC AB2023176]|uniref:UDP-3-O-acyl-N-acetylglucosamine deacetylase n=1 Tax=Roseomonas sp. CCTCC AB2023176 TaxID=3342640 RepID=UPI0035E15B2A
MDGYFPLGTTRFRTLKSAIGCVGTGLHSGARVSLTLRPAQPGTGIVFRRTDTGAEIAARYDNVTDTRLCTVLGEGPSRIGTVEHVMAALAGLGVTDAIVEVDGPEIPILDGSAAPFVFLLECAGLTTSAAPAPAIEVLRAIRVTDGDGPDAAWAELSPSVLPGLEADLTIDFGATAVGRQSLSLRLSDDTFRAVLAGARTFTMAEDVARLRAVGLAQGGSLANAVVVDGPLVLNPGGLRHPDEFVRHKLLDAVGDLALAGASLKATFRGHKSGHGLNNRVLRALFADETAYRWIGEDEGLLSNVRVAVAA